MGKRLHDTQETSRFDSDNAHRVPARQVAPWRAAGTAWKARLGLVWRVQAGHGNVVPMAENPAEWPKAAVVVNDVLDDIHRQNVEDIRTGDFHGGLSTPYQIVVALGRAGYLTDAALEHRDGPGRTP